jgi:hypothetical protein
MGQAGMIGERNMTAVRCDDTLLPTMTAGGIVYKIAISAELTSRVDGMPFSIVGILMKDDDGRTAMGLDVASSGHKR